MNAEVFWEGRPVGLLRNVVVDQPYYRGEWEPADTPEFAAALAVRYWLPVTFRTPDGSHTAPAAALADPTVGVYFRFG